MGLFGGSDSGSIFGIDKPDSLKEFLDPAGIFHDGGQFGMDLFGMDNTSDKEAAAIEEAQKAKAEANNRSAAEYEKSLGGGMDTTTIIIIAISIIALIWLIRS